MVSIFILQLCISLYAHCAIVIHDYETKLTASETKLTASETKLTASEEEQKELLRVLEQTKRMAYARDQQISMLESDGQLMLEKCEYLSE